MTLRHAAATDGTVFPVRITTFPNNLHFMIQNEDAGGYREPGPNKRQCECGVNTIADIIGKSGETCFASVTCRALENVRLIEAFFRRRQFSPWGCYYPKLNKK
ncbi:hypothetical protein N7508_008389 [Penicillium antarcticum]|uniref:uncharacterized protein n=1 Tax=Penicillium antarcticum TaxID=416450 RepID=UPI0023854880|nr:uncharacterized protein N7508_008389 [Penicillium antarcticum]KAJ5293568.1 hypothetical protein N7508_008389 [Penicillium antarcticum]